jgi:SAM-dependent methyltransferase
VKSASEAADLEKRLASIAVETAKSSIYTLEDQRRMTLAKNYFQWQGRLVRREIGQRVLEIGCGVGNFTEMLLERPAVVALDKEPTCIERLKHRYGRQHNLQAFICDVNSDNFLKFARFAPDLCVCLNVLEHIETDAAFLRRVRAVLMPGGALALMVPAFPALFGRIDQNLGHYRRYTIRSLRQLAEATGLRVERARYMNLAGFVGWWANAHVFQREAQSESQIRFFDRYIVPAASRIEAVVPPPFGQSIFAVLQKP